MKPITILIANVKYPSGDSYYLSANSYLLDGIDELEKSIEDFRNNVEVDGFRIVNMMAYQVPESQIEASYESMEKKASQQNESTPDQA
jgi:hypothetical protein